jgi:hypothetical protein
LELGQTTSLLCSSTTKLSFLLEILKSPTLLLAIQINYSMVRTVSIANNAKEATPSNKKADDGVKVIYTA